MARVAEERLKIVVLPLDARRDEAVRADVRRLGRPRQIEGVELPILPLAEPLVAFGELAGGV